jgi:SAM-dependent methyltransferase
MIAIRSAGPVHHVLGDGEHDAHTRHRAALQRSLQRPATARVYDHLLGGERHYAMDRALSDILVDLLPRLPEFARHNREFLGRAVSMALRRGCEQFLDLGCGVPATDRMVHQLVERDAPGTGRVVYVDNDPIAVAHVRLMLDEQRHESHTHESHTVVQADLCDPGLLWDFLTVSGALEMTRPVCLLAVGVLPWVTDPDRLCAAMDHHRRMLPPGSLLVASSLAGSGLFCGSGRAALRVMARRSVTSAWPLRLRGCAEFAPLLGGPDEGYEMVAPGLVPAPQWHPDDSAVSSRPPSDSAVLAGMSCTRAVSSPS